MNTPESYEQGALQGTLSEERSLMLATLAVAAAQCEANAIEREKLELLRTKRATLTDDAAIAIAETLIEKYQIPIGKMTLAECLLEAAK